MIHLYEEPVPLLLLWGLACCGLAHGNGCETPFFFKRPHDRLLPFIVVGIADDVSLKINAIHKNMNMRMLRIRMSAYDILLLVKPSLRATFAPHTTVHR